LIKVAATIGNVHSRVLQIGVDDGSTSDKIVQSGETSRKSKTALQEPIIDLTDLTGLNKEEKKD